MRTPLCEYHRPAGRTWPRCCWPFPFDSGTLFSPHIYPRTPLSSTKYVNVYIECHPQRFVSLNIHRKKYNMILYCYILFHFTNSLIPLSFWREWGWKKDRVFPDSPLSMRNVKRHNFKTQITGDIPLMRVNYPNVLFDPVFKTYIYIKSCLPTR